jgi:hypothetical protein
MAFLSGKADPWGMVVNPSYRDIDVPTAEWPLLDDYVPPTEIECYKQNPAPYFTQVAAPITSLQKIAEAVLDAWPNVQTKCDRSTSSDPWKIGRIDRQGVGSRFMLGLVSSGDAHRLGLNEARLLTRGGTYVAPSDATLTRALRVAEPSASGVEPFTLDMAKLRRANGYPGTMVVYTAARTVNLAKADAVKVATFIDVATSEGQRPGHGNGELPEGYLPLRAAGPTGPLLAQAGHVADLIRAQDPGETPPGDTDDPDGPTDDGGGDSEAPVEVPEDSTPAEQPGAEKPAKAGPVDMPATSMVASGPAGRLIPALLVALLLAVVAGSGLRIVALVRRYR